MSNRVQIRRSTAAGSNKTDPDAQDLLHGELMVTERNESLWYRDALGNNVAIGGEALLNHKGDGRYLRQSQNLADLSNVASARVSLDVYSTGEVDSKIAQIVTDHDLGSLGSAAFLDYGTAEGNVPRLGTGGKLSESVLPALALTEVFVVADIAARNALTVQEGDVAVVTDASADPDIVEGSASYIYNGTSWTRLKSPAKAHSELLGLLGDGEHHLSSDAAADTESYHDKFSRLDSIPGLVTDSHTHSNKSTLDGITSAKVSNWDAAHTHTSATDNPHNVTKAQVGLGSVQNYGIATQPEAEAGTSSSKYMTPQRTKQAIAKLVSVEEFMRTEDEYVYRLDAGGDLQDIDFSPATTLLAGILTATAQTIGGVKTFAAQAVFQQGADFAGSEIEDAIIDCGTI